MWKKGKRMLAFLLALCLITGLVPVQAQAASKKKAVTKVTLNKEQYVLKKGQKLKLKASVKPKSAKAKLSFKSSNKKVAAVTSKGVVTAKAAKGKATITVMAGKKKASCKITIGAPVTKINASDLKLTVGQSAKISAAVMPKNAKIKKLTYTSGAPAIASVSNAGVVKALKAGTAQITILAADRAKVKKVIRVTVTGKKEENVNPAPGPDPKPEDPVDKPEFSISLEQEKLLLELGERVKPEVTFTPESKVTDQDITWTSSDDTVAAVVSAQGDLLGLTPGTAVVTATSQQDARVSASMEVTVSEEGVAVREVTTGEELIEALNNPSAQEADAKNRIIRFHTTEKQVEIPEGTYGNVTLIVNAPDASIDNAAQFKQVLVQEIAKDTWCEKSGNQIFLDSETGHLTVDANGRPNVYLLDGTESVTVDNNGNLQELLIASAAQVLVKGDSVASPIDCEYYNGHGGIGRITTYVPLAIYSTTTYNLVIGPGGEQTAVRASRENDIPTISGLGTISVTIDSTGEGRTVIAENNGDLKDLPATTVRGKIYKDAGADQVVEATVYLVGYSVDISNDNISVYLSGNNKKQADTDDAGNYVFESVSIGNYVLVVEAEGYQLLTQHLYITDADRDYEVDDIILMDESGKAGRITGTLIDASTGNPIEKGITVILRKGMNNITTNEVAKVQSDGDGCYSFLDITPGQYTIQARDESDEPEYVSVYENVSVLAEASVTRNMTLTKALDSDEVRFVLTWDAQKEGVSADLDIHLYGPDPFDDTEYNVYFTNQSDWNNDGYLMNGDYARFAGLDVDDKAYEGPETITVKTVTAGQYKVFVQDYTNGGAGNGLAASNPVIKVYRGNTLIDTVKMSSQEGGVWFAGSYNNATGKFTVADEAYSGIPNTSTRAKIGKVLNQLTQFDVIDAAVFSEDQRLIDGVTADYLSQKTTDTQLTEDLEQIQALLDKLKDGVIMAEIKTEGATRNTYRSFRSYHDLGSVGGNEDELTGFEVVMQSEGASYRLEKMDRSRFDYRLVLQNAALGVSTNYYFDYYKYSTTERWVIDIQDPDNTGWKRECYEGMAYTGGMNPDIGRNLDITLEEGVSMNSMEYAADAEEGAWNYGEWVDLVLHLQRDETGATKDYLVRYKPLGAELIKITDTTNRIVQQYDSTYSPWYSEGNIINYRVFGENKTMGDNWLAEVSEGASYTLSEPDEEDYYDVKPEKKLTVTNTNGAMQVYHIYYYEDTSDAEIIGVYDPDNMYTSYSDNSSATSTGMYYTIRLQGMNSELGKNLQVHTKVGASAKVEYTTGSESWEYASSNARITVTAENGKQRIYYIIYGKEDDVCNIRGIKSNSNTLKKVYLSYRQIYITGTEAEVGDEGSLEIAANAGYTASYSKEGSYNNDGKITVTEDATGEKVEYTVSYTQDISGLRIRDITSAQSKIYSVGISNYLSTASETNEKYYRVDLVGEKVAAPTDLQAALPTGASAEVTYAGEDWAYASDYFAKITVTGADASIMYLVTYTQDDSGTVVRGISDSTNHYLYTSISTSDRYMRLKETQGDPQTPTSEQVYIIYVKGSSPQLGSSYELALPAGSKKSDVIHKGDAGWRYIDEYISRGDYDNGSYVYENYYYADRFVVEAANGASRIYLVAYAQDSRGATISGITDAGNEYLHTEISTGISNMSLNAVEGDAEAPTSEQVYVIYVKGQNSSLGSSYSLNIPQGSTVASTAKKGEAGWRYSSEYTSHSYSDEDGNWVSDRYDYADRIVVRAANGAERIYLVAYAQNQSGTAVSGITDTENEYLHTEISKSTSNMSLNAVEGDAEAPTSEQVYVIYVKGQKSGLGSSYTLSFPEGSTIVSTIKKGEEGWRYRYESTSHSYRGEDGSWVSDTYNYADRIVVRAANGAERIYLVAYAQDQSGTAVSKITDTENEYLYTEISTSTSNMYLNAVEGDAEAPTSEQVYVIYVKGQKSGLGDSYTLSFPEGSTIVSTIKKGEEGWRYRSESTSRSYNDGNGNRIYDTFYYADRILVQAANGASRIYLVAYVQDQSGTVASGITDTGNEYLHTEISTSTSNMYLNAVEGDAEAPTSEQVYLIYVKGQKSGLGSSYTLSIPEGSTASVTKKGEEGWRYRAESASHGYNDESGNWVNGTYYYADRIAVRAANGAERIYLVAYAQDDSGTVADGIADTENEYVHTQISTSASNMSLTAVEGDAETPTSEQVYLIYVKGQNGGLGSSYTLSVPEGSTTSVTKKGEEGWRYRYESTSHSYRDEDGNSVSDTYYYTDRIAVQAANGAKRIYLVAYAQDQSGTVASGITDAGNAYVHTEISTSTSNMYMTAVEGDAEAPTNEQVYVIYVKGQKSGLGSSYTLSVPEGSTTSVTRKGEEGWRYRYESTSHSYRDEDNKQVSDTYYYADRIVVKAANGAERIYLVAYAQDQSGTVASGITDAGNAYVHTEISTRSISANMTAVEGDAETPTSEQVYVIYVKGQNGELGSSYTLSIPEGSTTSVTRKGEEGWRYRSESTSHSYRDEDNKQVSDTYYYADRIVVKAANGAERVYLVAYASAASETA